MVSMLRASFVVSWSLVLFRHASRDEVTVLIHRLILPLYGNLEVSRSAVSVLFDKRFSSTYSLADKASLKQNKTVYCSMCLLDLVICHLYSLLAHVTVQLYLRSS